MLYRYFLQFLSTLCPEHALKKNAKIVCTFKSSPYLWGMIYDNELIEGAKLSELCLNVIDLGKEVAQFLSDVTKKILPSDITEKFHNNLVSYADIQAEQMLVKGLARLLPDAGFLTEENTITPTANDTYIYRWVIDPLDGTTNFLHKIPVYAISVALLHKNIPILGVVFDICRQDVFHAQIGNGAYCNGQPIAVSTTPYLAKALVATGFPYYDFTVMNSYMAVLQELIPNTQGIRRLGSAAIDLCYVAAGHFDSFFEHSLQPWDVAAGALIVQEAGGKVSDFWGRDNWLFGKQMVAANPLLHDQMLNLTSRQTW